MEKIFLVVTINTDIEAEIIPCSNREEALIKLRKLYLTKLHQIKQYDYYNSFLDEEAGYAQIVCELREIEFRIGKIAA